MKTWLALPLLLVLAGTGTAFAQDVRYNFDKQASFASYKTYRWANIKGSSKMSDLMDRQIKAAIDVELSKKGLTEVEEGQPVEIGRASCRERVLYRV